MPVVSVIIPVWNRAHVVSAAIDSVLAQRLPGDDWSLEVVVADDGSTDDLDRVLRPYGDRIKHMRHQRNVGAAAARNTGVAAASGDYLAFLDSDDVWLADKLVQQIGYMRKNGYGVSCTACYLARPGAADVVWPSASSRLLTRADLVWGCFISPGTTMICEPSVFKEVGPFDTTLKRHEDWDWLLRLTARLDLAYLGLPLARREPSPHVNSVQVQDALQAIRAKHIAGLPSSTRRRFEAALAWETAYIYHREGDRVSAVRAVVKSLRLAPFGHPGLSAAVAKCFSGW
jgi:glycosyltransferase involved in cell wall biosynthesis